VGVRMGWGAQWAVEKAGVEVVFSWLKKNAGE